MREIKFRSWNPERKRFHYWGFGLFKEKTFTGVESPLHEAQQYTGLKDKNRKEIYEGDILRYDGATCKVVFSEGKFWLYGFGGCDFYYMADYSEVIGNIYENPELLQKEKK